MPLAPVGSTVVNGGAAAVTTFDVNLPAGAAAGDLALLLLRVVPGAAVTTGPAGSTELHNADGGNSRLGLWVKFLDAVDITAGKLTATRSVSSAWAAVLRVWRGAAVDQVSALAASTSVSTTATLPAITPGAADALRVGAAVCRTDATGTSTSFTQPAGWSEVGDTSDAVSGRRGTAWMGELQLVGPASPQGTESLAASGAGMTWGALSLTLVSTTSTVTGTATAGSTVTAAVDGTVRHPATAAAGATATAAAAGTVRHLGAAALSVSVSATAAGRVRHGGVAAAGVTVTATAAGRVRHSATASAGSTVTAAAVGGVRHAGVAAAGSSATATAAGRIRHTGLAAASIAVTATALGTVVGGGSTVTGTASAGSMVTAPAAGRIRHLGVASAGSTSSTSAAGRVRHLASASAGSVGTARAVGAASGRVVLRPAAGQVTRLDGGLVDRPYAGIVVRP